MGAVAGFFVATPSAEAQADAVVALDLAHPGKRVTREFSGLSYEMASIMPSTDTPPDIRADNKRLIALFRSLDIGSLRIGGNSSDRNATQLPSNRDLDALFEFARAADVEVIYCLQLYRGNPAIAARTAKYLVDRYGTRIDAFSIGQEPSAYPVGTPAVAAAREVAGAAEKYPYAEYRDEWRRFAAAIHAAAPSARLCGPSVHNNPAWMNRFMDDFGRRPGVVMVTGHLYPGGAAGMLPSAEVGRDRMLSEGFASVDEKLLAGFAAHANALGLPFRLEEVNSYFHGGADGVSNTFAAALWGLDFMHWWAAHGAIGLNFHTGRVATPAGLEDARYAVFQTLPDGFAVRPLGYAMKAFALGGRGRIIPLTLENYQNHNLSGYAVLTDDGKVHVTLINKEYGAHARPTTVALAGIAPKSVRTITLCAPRADLAAASGITLGGAEIDRNGDWHGVWKTALPSSDDPCSVTLLPASAMIVELNP